MKILFVIFLSSVFTLTTFLPAQAQVDNINKEKEKHHNNKDDNNNNNEDTDRISLDESDPIADACFSACAEMCFEVAAAIFVEAMAAHHQDLMANKDSDPTVLSVDVMPHFAYGYKDQYFSMLPRVRGTFGVLSTDFRFNHLADWDSIGIDIFRQYDWQILQLNFVAGGVFNFRIGSGLLWEPSNSDDRIDVYNQHSVLFGLRFDDQRYLATFEARSSWDYETGQNIFHEGNLRFGYRFLAINHLYGYLTAGALYQNYYTAVDLLALQAGLTLNIH